MSWILGQIGAKRAELEGRVELLRKGLTDAQDELAEVLAAERVVARIVTAARDAPDQASDARDATPFGMITVPVRGTGAVPQDYAELWELITTAPKALTCKDLCTALGWELLPKNTEGLRSKLKRMVERGWLAEERPGKFTAAAQEVSRGQPTR
jgi:hypothetical protein